MNLKLEFESFQDFAARLWPCLSEDGMWVATDAPAEVGELVDFDVALADGFRLFHGSGQVVGVGPGPGAVAASRDRGLAIRFWELDQPSRNLLRKVVHKHAGEGGEPFALDAITEGGAPAGGGGLEAPFPEIDAGSAFSDPDPGLESFFSPSAAVREAVDADPGEAVEADPDERGGSRRPTLSEMTSTFEDVLAETQRVEPLEDDDETMRRAAEAISFEPDPGWAPPPALGRTLEMPPPVQFDEPFESESIELEPRTRRGGSWAPWAVVGVLAVTAGLFVATRPGTPLAGWLGRGDTAPPAETVPDPPVRETAPEPSLAEVPGVAADDPATAEATAPPPAESTAPPQSGADVSPTDAAENEAATERSAGPRREAAPAVAAPPEPIVEAPPQPRVVATPEPPPAAPDDLRLRLVRVTWREVDGDTVVRLWLSGGAESAAIETLQLRDGAPRAVLKIDGVGGDVPSGPLAIGSSHVRQLRFGLHRVASGQQLHVVADLASPDVELVGSPQTDDEGLELRFRR